MEQVYKDRLIEKGADIKNALRHFMGKEAMYEKYLVKFFEEEPNYEKLLKTLEEHDYQEAFKCVHTLKGVSINLGLMPLYQVLFDLTEDLRNKSAAEVNVAEVEAKKKEMIRIYNEFADIIRESRA